MTDRPVQAESPRKTLVREDVLDNRCNEITNIRLNGCRIVENNQDGLKRIRKRR